jgi:hypothetical protein
MKIDKFIITKDIIFMAGLNEIAHSSLIHTDVSISVYWSLEIMH